MHSLAASKEKDKSKSYFMNENKRKEHKLSSNYMKVFQILYWICKEEVAVVKTVSLLNLIEKLGVTELKDFETRSSGTIQKMILTLTTVVREKLVDKIKQSDGCGCLTDEKTDISNICNLLTFIHFFDISTGKTMTSFVNGTDILDHSENRVC